MFHQFTVQKTLILRHKTITMGRYILSMLVLVFFIQPVLYGQNKRLDLQKKREAEAAARKFKGEVFKPGDSLHVILNEVEILRAYPFKSKKEEKKYNQLQVDLLKVYPLAHIVGSEFNLVKAELDTMPDNQSLRKGYLKRYQKYVYNTYYDSLKTLNVRQGRLLLKLIDRETGKTPFELIKTYRGGFNAVLWQSAAFMFGANLKSEFDPVADSMIEHIIKKIQLGGFN